MNPQQSRLLSQQLLEMLALDRQPEEMVCKKKDCCKKFKKGKRCKKCPEE